MLTDTHCHIFKEDYDDISKVIEEAKKNNVSRFLNNATDIASCKEVLRLSKTYSSMYAALGIHPEFADTYLNSDLDYIVENIKNEKVIALGEIGLDYHYNKDNKDKQIKLFKSQLEIAEKYNLPVIIHNREATMDIINTLNNYHVKGVIHCFNGSLETANILIKKGFLLGINGVVTFKNCKLKDILPSISIKNIVLETDCPYLTPEPYRGKKNEPKYIKEIANFISNIYQIPTSQVEKITNDNIKRVFDI